MGGPWRVVRRLESSPRSRVWLAEFEGAPAVVKRIVGGADARSRYEREIVALGLAARARPAVAPTLLFTDPAKRVLVLEYLTDAVADPDWTIGYAVALARLHATTTAADAGALPAWQAPDRADVDA